MKNAYYIVSAFTLFFALCPSGAHSQSLTFSRVIIVKVSEDTVPVGKVWKVESYLQKDANIGSGTSSNCASVNAHSISVNGANYWMLGEITTGLGAVYSTVDHKLPFWLPAGYRLKTMCADDLLSVIEFTVTP